MMKVEIINKEQVEQLMPIWGETACICYDTPTKFKNGVAKTVLSTGHFSGSRGQYIYFKIEDVPRSLADQMARHSVGTAVNMQSFRYVKMEDFTYYTPSLIEKYPEAKAIYEDTMEVIKHNYNEIVDILNEKGIKGEKANQSARGILPMNTNTKLIMAFTLEALINFMEKRLCVRAEEHIRKLAKLMRDEVVAIIPELEDKLVPACEAKLYCPEGKMCCGKYPTKDQLKEILNNHKK